MNLNVKDRKILAELDLNARCTFQALGKKTRLSKETAIYRVKNLEKKGIIQRYTTLVNFSKLGYTGYGIFSRFQNVTDEIKQQIIDYLTKIPELYWVALVGGKFDIVFGIMAKSVNQFNKIYYKILNKYGQYLVDNTIVIRTELRQHKRDYLIEKDPDVFNPSFFGKDPEVEELDELDSSILSILSNDARINVVEFTRNIFPGFNYPLKNYSLRQSEFFDLDLEKKVSLLDESQRQIVGNFVLEILDEQKDKV